MRIDHGEEHSFTFERQALPLVEEWASSVLVERELHTLATTGTASTVVDVNAVNNFEYNVLCREDDEGRLQLMHLGELTGNPEHHGHALAFTAPDHVQDFINMVAPAPLSCPPSPLPQQLG